jgi:hypothetical protein
MLLVRLRPPEAIAEYLERLLTQYGKYQALEKRTDTKVRFFEKRAAKLEYWHRTVYCTKKMKGVRRRPSSKGLPSAVAPEAMH